MGRSKLGGAVGIVRRNVQQAISMDCKPLQAPGVP